MSSTFFAPTQQLLCKDGSTALASHALTDARYVLIYFAASWCEPCCEFAPLLRTFYETYHIEKKFEVVLLSFDNSEKAMMDYFVNFHGNYYCLPYADAQATRIQWMEQYNVKGLPSLVVFDNDAARAVVTHYGCNMVVADPEGTNFPWPQIELMPTAPLDCASEDVVAVTVPPSVATKDKRTFFDDTTLKLLRQDDSTVLATEALQEAEFVLVYCSAHWCPPCRNFTPMLKKFYEEHHVEKKFEIVFLSFDNSEEEMLEYFKEAHGNYYCLSYDDAQAMKPAWMNLYSVKFIPTLLVFENGYPRVLTTQHGREMVVSDPGAESFPWTDACVDVRDTESHSLPWSNYYAVPRQHYRLNPLLNSCMFCFGLFMLFCFVGLLGHSVISA